MRGVSGALSRYYEQRPDTERKDMAEKPQPQDTPRRPFKEYDDNHFHDDDEVAPPPDDEPVSHPATPQPPTRRARKLPPPPRRFYEE